MVIRHKIGLGLVLVASGLAGCVTQTAPTSLPSDSAVPELSVQSSRRVDRPWCCIRKSQASYSRQDGTDDNEIALRRHSCITICSFV